MLEIKSCDNCFAVDFCRNSSTSFQSRAENSRLLCAFAGSRSRCLSGASQQILSRPRRWRCCQHYARHFNQKLQWRHSRYHPTYAIPQQSKTSENSFVGVTEVFFFFTGLSLKYSILGLETGWRCYLSSRTEVGFHRSELSGAGFLDNDGQSLRHEIFQNRKFRCLFYKKKTLTTRSF